MAGVSCADGSVNVHPCERELEQYLRDALAEIDADQVYVKARQIDLDYTPTRIGKGLARLKRVDCGLELEMWSSSSPKVWLVERAEI